MNTIPDDLYKKFSEFLERRSGIVLGDNKQYLVKSRLSPLVSKFGCSDLVEIINRSMMMQERELKMAVVDAMTTNETLWFRDVYPFQLLTDKILIDVAKKGRKVRIWSAASSSGQEPYSIAMTLLEHQVKKPGTLSSGGEIIATDISAEMLAQCEKGEYDNLALARGLSLDRKRQFFEPCEGDKMRIVSRVRQLVTFKSFNLLDNYSLLGKFDIIFCRNVLIYFSADVKSKILNQFASSLNPGGYLMLGASESLTGLTDKFEMIRCNPGIMYQIKEGSPGLFNR